MLKLIASVLWAIFEWQINSRCAWLAPEGELRRWRGFKQTYTKRDLISEPRTSATPAHQARVTAAIRKILFKRFWKQNSMN